MTIEQIKNLRSFTVEGSLLDDENATEVITFQNPENDDELFTADVYCRNFENSPDGDEYDLRLEDIYESKLESTEIEIECFKDSEDNKIELDSEAYLELEKIIFEKC